jgi:hypothetical protein
MQQVWFGIDFLFFPGTKTAWAGRETKSKACSTPGGDNPNVLSTEIFIVFFLFMNAWEFGSFIQPTRPLLFLFILSQYKRNKKSRMTRMPPAVYPANAPVSLY